MHPRRGGVWLVWLDASLSLSWHLSQRCEITVPWHYCGHNQMVNGRISLLCLFNVLFNFVLFFVHFFQSQPIVTLKTSNFQVKNDTILICTMSILVGKIMHAALCAHAILSAEHQHSIWNNNVMQ